VLVDQILLPVESLMYASQVLESCAQVWLSLHGVWHCAATSTPCLLGPRGGHQIHRGKNAEVAVLQRPGGVGTTCSCDCLCSTCQQVPCPAAVRL
jgi:hypothetical protein